MQLLVKVPSKLYRTLGGTVEKPEILVVEDEEDARTIIANELQGQGARVLLAEDDAQGLEVFYRHASSIDAVVTDMRLRSKRRDDHSGARLGEKIKQLAPRLPVYCNSAIDLRAKFPFFEQYFIKGSEAKGDDIYQNISAIVEAAAAYENSRFAEVPESLVRLKAKYQITDSDFSELVGSRRLLELERTALLLFHKAVDQAEAIAVGESPSAEPVSTEISFVQPGDREARDLPLKKAIPIVIEKTADIWIAELFGFPLIYTYADERDEAIRNLLNILLEYSKNVTSEASLPGRSGSDHIRFAGFLKLLFG